MGASDLTARLVGPGPASSENPRVGESKFPVNNFSAQRDAELKMHDSTAAASKITF